MIRPSGGGSWVVQRTRGGATPNPHPRRGRGTGGNTIASPDAAGGVGYFTSLALDTANHPVVSYWDATNGDLKVPRCTTPSCS